MTRRQFWELIYEAAAAGTTVLVTTHYMDEAEYCDRISIMVAGKIGAIGTPADLKTQFGVETIDELFVRLARPEVNTSVPGSGGTEMTARDGSRSK
jgi:ABC-2 type transport system ATP-binding protein